MPDMRCEQANQALTSLEKGKPDGERAGNSFLVGPERPRYHNASAAAHVDHN